MADAASLHHEMINVVQKGDYGRLRELYADDYQYESNTGESGNAEAAVAIAQGYLSAFPDMTFDVRHEFTAGDTSVIEFTASGTHQGELAGIAPTGKSVSVDVCNIIEVRDGKIAREREYFDQLGMMQQLGVIPTE